MGGRLQKESIEINKSLFTLRKVISALTQQSTSKDPLADQVYVPYRDSKLTCLLRQSLGGNATCCMIACLQPSESMFDENHNTLVYAAQASKVKNKPIRNDNP